MKKITKLMSIIQVVWIYLVGVLLFNIDKVESSFQGAYFIGIVIISIIVNILTIISATAEKKEAVDKANREAEAAVKKLAANWNCKLARTV